MVGTPTTEQLNNVKQDTVQWSAKSHRVTQVDSSGNVNSEDNPSQVNLAGKIDLNNSTTTPLLSGETWTGTATEILDYAGIGVQVTTDVSSDVKGFKVEYSEDGLTDWKEGEGYTIPANTTKFFAPSTGQGAYYRLKYTNNGVDQTTFHVHTIIKKTPFRNTSHNLNDNLNDDDDGDLTVSVLKLRTAQNDYVSASSTASGNFKVSLEEFENGISEDSNTTLRVAPIIEDEFGNIQRQLGDNIFKGAIIAIPPEHHEIHCGDSYEANYVQILGNGGILDILIIVPNEGLSEVHPGDAQDTKQYHFKGSITTSSTSRIEFYEGVTATAGTAIPVYCRNRNFTIGDTISISQAPTVTATGTTKLVDTYLGSDRTVGGTAERADEFILKDNTIYLLRITNLETTNNYVSTRLDYYVHPGV